MDTLDRTKDRTKKAAIGLLGLGLLLLPAVASPAPAAQARRALADPAFDKVWDRTDKPIEDRQATRSWTWGPEPFYTVYEPYAEGPGGQHLVTYFDKSRMEINNPAADRNSPWFVTNGLIVTEMMAGQIQMGNSMFAPAQPANIPVAGDMGNANTPTYASLGKVASLKGDNRAPNRTGQDVREGIGRDGKMAVLDNLSGFSKYAIYEPTLGHNIPDVFWSFLNSKGVVYKDGRYVEDTIVDWLFAMGYPLTEPYWVQIRVGNEDRWVLMQAFQRRILTYSPHNPEGWKVEMGNVGRAYYDWRYKGQAVVPTSIPAPVQAALSISPGVGDATTQVTVSGKGFPASAQVTISAENRGAGYARNIGTTVVAPDGSFSANVRVPAEAAKYGQVEIVATAGAVRTSQTYRMQFDPQISVQVSEVVVNSNLRVRGTGFPGRMSVRLGLHTTATGAMDWRGSAKTNDNGDFDATISVGNYPTGALLTVVATGEGNIKATTRNKISVLAQPSVSITPNSGSTGIQVTLTGKNWPAGRPVTVGLRAKNSRSEALLPQQPVADAAGNFSMRLTIGKEYTGAGEVRVIASEGRSGLRRETTFTITGDKPVPTATPVPFPTPNGKIVPAGLPMTITSYRKDNGPIELKVEGMGWQPGKTINLSVISADGRVNTPVGSAVVAKDGRFGAIFTAAAPWWGRPDLGVRATTNDPAQSSVRYLPFIEMVAVDGGTYRVRGAQWPANAPVRVMLNLEGQDASMLGAATTDANGAFILTVVLPRIPSSNKNDVTIMVKDQPYMATFDF